MPLAAWLHDWSPFVLRITDSFGIRWYGLAYVAGFVAAWLILSGLARRGRILVKTEEVGDLIVAVIVGTIVGGRLGYCLFYRPELLWTVQPGAPWWGVLAINEGGMASHGGMVGITLACVWFARRRGIPAWHVADCLSLVAPVGIFFGRLANFINGELLGRVVAMPGQHAPWWSVKYPQELLEGHAPALTPEQTFQLESLLLERAQPGDTVERAVSRVIDAVQQGDAELARRLEPLIAARAPSQLLQALAEGVVVMAVLWAVWRTPRRPGVITALFLVVYGVGRVLTEFVRLPDAHLSVQRVLGMSRGQWLSVAMVVLGALLLRHARRAGRQALGGWSAKAATASAAPTNKQAQTPGPGPATG